MSEYSMTCIIAKKTFNSFGQAGQCAVFQWKSSSVHLNERSILPRHKPQKSQKDVSQYMHNTLQVAIHPKVNIS